MIYIQFTAPPRQRSLGRQNVMSYFHKLQRKTRLFSFCSGCSCPGTRREITRLDSRTSGPGWRRITSPGEGSTGASVSTHGELAAGTPQKTVMTPTTPTTLEVGRKQGDPSSTSPDKPASIISAEPGRNNWPSLFSLRHRFLCTRKFCASPEVSVLCSDLKNHNSPQCKRVRLTARIFSLKKIFPLST